MYCIKNGKIFTITNGIIDKGDILVRDGKIEDIGVNLNVPDGYTIIDAEGMLVYPGFIDAHCHAGIMESGEGGDAGDDTNEMTDPVTPNVRAIDGINPVDTAFRDALVNGGITSVMVAPGSANIIGGEVCALKTCGKIVDDMILEEIIGMKMALGENPKRVYGSKGKTPFTRMANAAVMRESFFKTQEYIKNRAKKDSTTPYDLKYENLAKVIKREIPARIHCHRADDIATAIRIMKEFGLDYIIEHTTEGHLIPDYIALQNISVCVGPTLTGKSKLELRNKTIDTVKVLHDRGVKVCISTDHPVFELFLLPVAAGYAMKTGLSHDDIIKMITINPAEVCRISDRVGSLEVGKHADIILWDKNPLNTGANVQLAMVNGKIEYKK
jgi:imidazolonepropionase-like amidohydrolase